MNTPSSFKKSKIHHSTRRYINTIYRYHTIYYVCRRGKRVHFFFFPLYFNVIIIYCFRFNVVMHHDIVYNILNDNSYFIIPHFRTLPCARTSWLCPQRPPKKKKHFTSLNCFKSFLCIDTHKLTTAAADTVICIIPVCIVIIVIAVNVRS